MKKIIITSAVALAAVMAAPAESTISITQTSHDFGIVKEDGGPVSCRFEFTNDGDTPLVIIDAKAECGCTKPSYTLRPVEPGKTGEIKVTYLPAGRPGEFTKSVKVTTNDPKKKKFKIKISGTVVPSQK